MSEWISVKERLPEEGEQVLLLWKHLDHMENGQLDEGQYILFDGESMSSHPTHWMPLPEPPEVSS